MKRIIIAAIAVALAACGDRDEAFVDAATDAASVVDAASCDGLLQGECRRTPGCVADLCPGCACAMIYRGCLAEGTQPVACPDLGCPGASCCHANADCAEGSCVAPGEQVCGGACNPQEDECSSDRDCQTGVGPLFICEPVPCACNGGARACTAGCLMNEDCGAGEMCMPQTGRCEPLGCGTDPVAPCPPDFDCVDEKCRRTACTDDLPCDGFCVDQLCQGSLGVCQLPPP